MKSLLVIIFSLLLVIRCYGNTTDNCTTFPTFTNYSKYSTGYHCYMYGLSQPYFHQEVDMTVGVSEDNVTLIWYTREEDGVDVLVCHDVPCADYVWSIDNKTLRWLDPNDTKIFYVDATNSCGGNATACFKVKPECQPCGDDCHKIPGPTNSSIKVEEHSDPTFSFTIKAEVSTRLKWCFVGSDHYNVCCYCNVEDAECAMPDWKMATHYEDCYHYTCSLIIHSVSMNYSDGMLIGTAAESPENIKDVNYTRIFVTKNNDKHRSLPVSAYYAITGVGITAAVIIMVICVVYVIRRRYRWSSSYYMHGDYESIPSPPPLQKTAPIPINDDFYSDDNDDDVRSCDLENIVSTPLKDV